MLHNFNYKTHTSHIPCFFYGFFFLLFPFCKFHTEKSENGETVFQHSNVPDYHDAYWTIGLYYHINFQVIFNWPKVKSIGTQCEQMLSNEFTLILNNHLIVGLFVCFIVFILVICFTDVIPDFFMSSTDFLAESFTPLGFTPDLNKASYKL